MHSVVAVCRGGCELSHVTAQLATIRLFNGGRAVGVVISRLAPAKQAFVNLTPSAESLRTCLT